jgi:hypothetical protein
MPYSSRCWRRGEEHEREQNLQENEVRQGCLIALIKELGSRIERPESLPMQDYYKVPKRF